MEICCKDKGVSHVEDTASCCTADKQPLMHGQMASKCCKSSHAKKAGAHHPFLLHVGCCLGMGLLFLLFLFSRPSSSSNSLEAAAAAQAKSGSMDMDALSAGRIVGDLVDPFPHSQLDIKVCYDTTHVVNGMELTPHRARYAPDVELAGKAVNGDLYCLVMTDPDAPSPDNPTKREWLHWIVKDIPGTALASHGVQVVPYNGPTPPKGLHRYAFIVFKQPGPVDIEAPANRANFNTRKFAAAHNLQPVAAVFFLAKREED